MQETSTLFSLEWLGLLIGLIGLVAGAWFFIRSKRVAKLAYQKSSSCLIGRDENNLPEEVVIIFKGKKVKRLTKTVLILWNNGTEVIDRKDLVSLAPITISFCEGDNILSYKILKRTRDVNNFSIVKYERQLHRLQIEFDYLDPNDGAVIEILHDSEKRYPEITGAIKGMPKGFIDKGSIPNTIRLEFSYVRRSMFWIVLIMGVMLIASGMSTAYDRNVLSLHIFDTGQSEIITPIMFGFIYSAISIFMLWFKGKKYPKQLEILKMSHGKNIQNVFLRWLFIGKRTRE